MRDEGERISRIQSLRNIDEKLLFSKEDHSQIPLSELQHQNLEDQGFRSFKRKFFKSNESVKHKSHSQIKTQGSPEKRMKSSKKHIKRKQPSSKIMIDMKKKNAHQFQVIHNGGNGGNGGKGTVNLTQKFKTPRDLEKKKRNNRERENKENATKNNIGKINPQCNLPFRNL